MLRMVSFNCFEKAIFSKFFHKIVGLYGEKIVPPDHVVTSANETDYEKNNPNKI